MVSERCLFLAFGLAIVSFGCKAENVPACPAGSIHTQWQDPTGRPHHQCKVPGKLVNGLDACLQFDDHWDIGVLLPCTSSVSSYTEKSPQEAHCATLMVYMWDSAAKSLSKTPTCILPGWKTHLPDDNGNCPTGYANAATRNADVCVGPKTQNAKGAGIDSGQAKEQVAENAKATQEAARSRDPYSPPDGAQKASSRREFARLVESRLRSVLASDERVDPTLVRLRISTSTPKSPRGLVTRDDYRLEIETNTISLPRDVTAMLRNKMLNADLFNLGFKEVTFQDTVGTQHGTILCAVSLGSNGAHPNYCMQMGYVTHYMGSYGEERVPLPGWNEYHRWPANYIIP